MSFLKIKQVTLAGVRNTFISTSAIAYIQEITPEQDPAWQVGAEPSRTLIFLHQKLEPIISIDNFETIAKQIKGFGSASGMNQQPNKKTR
ncbi:hypothetical protein [Candidatus Nitronereus thalassa]|uniref:Uncharacterized protein n=1 Tax=Candidatus Nitronereus thalassa TaxID=3020898 RepID=A0ABU3KBT6_9BACT|nr:hypothetical protein [Candidatus Nitronereus thalassa]MDT7043882.1 hypothetical protein [Candidatus Nitronereus thalassa]